MRQDVCVKKDRVKSQTRHQQIYSTGDGWMDGWIKREREERQTNDWPALSQRAEVCPDVSSSTCTNQNPPCCSGLQTQQFSACVLLWKWSSFALREAAWRRFFCHMRCRGASFRFWHVWKTFGYPIWTLMKSSTSVPSSCFQHRQRKDLLCFFCLLTSKQTVWMSSSSSCCRRIAPEEIIFLGFLN